MINKKLAIHVFWQTGPNAQRLHINPTDVLLYHPFFMIGQCGAHSAYGRADCLYGPYVAYVRKGQGDTWQAVLTFTSFSTSLRRIRPLLTGVYPLFKLMKTNIKVFLYYSLNCVKSY